ncbi:MAG: hypothetical protein GVY18_12030 [Bacteroidetes bacterium]|jgi:hypothetical protein|nr:hypothetical protein [Bacteroidota bacterium]
MRPHPILVLVSVALLLSACKLLEETEVSRPDYTWTNGTPPSARTAATPQSDTTRRDESPPLRVPDSLDQPPADPDTVTLAVVVDDSVDTVSQAPNETPQPPSPPPDTAAVRQRAEDATPPPRPDTSKPPIRFPEREPAPPDTTSAAQPPPDTTSAEPVTAPPVEPAIPDTAERMPEPPVPARETARDTVASDAAPPEASGSLDLINRENREDLSLPDFLTGRNKQGGSTALRFRRYVPPDTPSYVARTREDVPLFLADETEAGWLAFYKGNCGGLGEVCNYRAALYDPTGTERWTLDLNQFLTQDRFVEIQDIRLHDGALYFNEACATYADEADGQCSSLVRVDPEFEEVLWRTPPLTSNNIFIFADPYVVAGYGFTAEPDALYLVEQRTGRLAAEADLDSAHEYLEIQDGMLYVVTYRSVYAFDLMGSE